MVGTILLVLGVSLVGLILFVLFGNLLFSPSCENEKVKNVDDLFSWGDALRGLIFGGIYKKISMDWMKVGKDLGFQFEEFCFNQKDIDEYSRGLQLKDDSQAPKFGEHVPIGLLVTIGVRACYTAIISPKQRYQHFHFFGLVVRSFTYESVKPIKIGQKLKIIGAAESEYVKRGIDFTGSATIADQQTGEVLGKVTVVFLKMTKHGKKIPKKNTPRKEFSDENQTGKAQVWKTDKGLPGRWLDISGDPNPIHMHPILGMLFGLPSSIVHGTWIFSKAMISLEQQFVITQSRVEMKFIKPLVVGKTGTLKTYKTEKKEETELAVWVGKKEKSRVGAFATIKQLNCESDFIMVPESNEKN